MQTSIIAFDDIVGNSNPSCCRTGWETQHNNVTTLNHKIYTPGAPLYWRDGMEMQEIKLGEVTYHVSRTFIGLRTATELLIDHVVEQAREDVAIDVTEKPAV